MKSKYVIFLLVLALLLALASDAFAMTSTNYRMDWFVPLVGGGSGASSSTNYKANFTVGQTANGASSSPNYAVGLGFWYGADVCLSCLYLPLIQR
jgi:hypothetical protein